MHKQTKNSSARLPKQFQDTEYLMGILAISLQNQQQKHSTIVINIH